MGNRARRGHLVTGLLQMPTSTARKCPILLAGAAPARNIPISTALSVLSSSQPISRLGEGATLWVPQKLADPIDSLEGGEHEDVEQLDAGSGPNANLRHIALDHETAVVDGVDHDRERQRLAPLGRQCQGNAAEEDRWHVGRVPVKECEE